MEEINDKNSTTREIAIGLAKDVYNDAGKAIVKPTGELVGILPRVIKAALAPVEKWVLQREYNIEETKKLLEEKLKSVPAENIQPPDAHIAVPTIQYISYCMDNAELRNMYANLLAKSMNVVVRDGVHPGFVEIIKQLSPDEAKILRYLSENPTIPTIILRRENKRGEGVDIIKNFSNIGELSGCERPFSISLYFNNLVRLGLIDDFQGEKFLVDNNLYKPLKTHKYILEKKEEAIRTKKKTQEIVFQESVIQLTEYGKHFCDICIT